MAPPLWTIPILVVIVFIGNYYLGVWYDKKKLLHIEAELFNDRNPTMRNIQRNARKVNMEIDNYETRRGHRRWVCGKCKGSNADDKDWCRHCKAKRDK